MKIVSQTADELLLKEGSATGIAVGAVFALVGIIVGVKFHAASPAMIWIALGVVAIGIGIILFASSITLTANRRSGQLTYEKKRIIGGQNMNYAIADVFRIETRRQWRIENQGAPPNQGEAPRMPVLVSQSVIIFRDGRELPLDHQKTASNTQVGGVVIMGGQGAEAAIASRVAEFLNVPFQEMAPPNIGMGIGIGF